MNYYFLHSPSISETFKAQCCKKSPELTSTIYSYYPVNLTVDNIFRSKEISKSSVVDDMVESNEILYPDGKKPDHVIVIKYVPFVNDSKRAMDEYTASIFMGGFQTLVIHNTCEDSLLAAPLILDLCILTELFSRIQYRNKSTNGVLYLHNKFVKNRDPDFTYKVSKKRMEPGLR